MRLFILSFLSVFVCMGSDAQEISIPAPVADANGNFPVVWQLVDGGGFPAGSNLSGAFTATPGHMERTRYAANNFQYTGPPQETFDVALGWHGIRPTKTSQPWETAASPTIASKREFVMFGEGQLSGHKIEFCAQALVPPGGQNASFMVLSASPEIFRAWDAPLTCAQRAGYLKNPAAIGEDVRHKIVTAASYDQWAEIYTALGNMTIQGYVDAFTATSKLVQQQTLSALNQANQSMTEQTGCILTPGCSPHDLPVFDPGKP